MNFKSTLYNIITYPLQQYKEKYMPPYSHVGQPPEDWISDFDQASTLIYNLLETNSSCLVGRYGSNEFLCMENYMKHSHPFWFLRNICPFWVSPSIKKSMKENAGFFSPEGNKAFSKFADLYYESAKEVDILACWFSNEKIVEKQMNYKICYILSIEPYWSSNPWTRYLKGKKVLVIHPFKDSILSQYQKRDKLFDNPNVLPEFGSLKVIKAIQSIGGEENGFRDWFEALKYMENEVDNTEYDVALIGCGAYGLPLAAHCKKMGKKVLHLGGALQLLFGIKGTRWESSTYGRGMPGINYPKLLSNPYWIRPLENERPRNADKVEGACYW